MPIKKEFALQEYLAADNGKHLAELDPALELIETEHKFRGGRIDILAKRQDILVGIELKSNSYQTRGVCAQLLNYLTYLSSEKGEVYFVAPKIKYGIYSTLQPFYEGKVLHFFEYSKEGKNYFFRKIKPSEINDVKKAFYEDEPELLTEEKIKKGINIILGESKEAKLMSTIIDTKKSKKVQLDNITESIFGLMPKNYGFLKKAYEIMKLLE
ncbi:MAG: hypothetical protein ACP5N3_02025 [Candidatus Nanoarchaeia archaeon]